MTVLKYSIRNRCAHPQNLLHLKYVEEYQTSPKQKQNMSGRSPNRRNEECAQTVHEDTAPKEGHCSTPQIRLINVTEENIHLFKVDKE